MTDIPRIVRCPRCGKSTEYTARNPSRPFCSERCRTADLGDWADGKYSLPVEPENITEEDMITLEKALGSESSDKQDDET